MTNEEALWIALSQSAIDHGCRPEDFLSGQNKAVPSRNSPDARRYLCRPQALELTSYGANAVASASPELMEAAKAYVDRYPAVHCFQTPQLLVLSKRLRPFGMELCFMGEYFLPDLDRLRGLDCGLCCRTLEREQLASLSAQLWPNALSQDAREWDVLGVGAYEGERLVGLAACSADCQDHVADRRGRAAGLSKAGRRLGADEPAWPWRFWREGPCPSTVAPGPTWHPSETPFAAAFGRLGYSCRRRSGASPTSWRAEIGQKGPLWWPGLFRALRFVLGYRQIHFHTE